MMSILKAEK